MAAESPPSHLQIAQLLATHLGHRDFDQFTDLLADDVEYRVGGNHALAGVFRGRDEVTAHVRELVDRTDETFDAFKWEDWLVGERHVAALVRIRGQGHGAIFASRIVVLFAFDTRERVSEMAVLLEDAGAIERFFGP